MAFNPAFETARLAFETAQFVHPPIADNPGAWQQVEMQPGDSLVATHNSTPIPTLRAGSAPPDLIAKILSEGVSMPVAWDSETLCKLVASALEGGATPVEAPTDVWTHKLARSLTDVTFGQGFAFERNRDDSEPQLFRDGHTSQLVFTFAEGAVLTGTVQMSFTRMDYMGDRQEVAVTATPTPPIVRGFPDLTHRRDATSGEWFLKRVAGATPPAIRVQEKWGAAAVYSASRDILPGRWYVAHDEAGLPIGDPRQGEDFALNFQLPVDDGTDADEWKFDRLRGVFVPSASPIYFPTVLCTVEVDGDQIEWCPTQIQVTYNRPVRQPPCFPGRFRTKTLRRGKHSVEVTLQREYEDRLLQDKLEHAESIALRVSCKGTQYVAASTVQHELILEFPLLRPSGPTATVTAETQSDEQLTFSGHDDLSAGDPDLMTATFVNSLTTIA